jgi:hypothetical protein
MTQQRLEYASDISSGDLKLLRVAFWICLIYDLLLAGVTIWYGYMFSQFWAFLSLMPREALFVKCLYISMFLLPALAVSNALPLVAYRAGAGGRSPRALMLAYIAVQVLLIAMYWVVQVYLVRISPFNYTVGGRQASISTDAESLVGGAIVQAILSLPLLAMLIPAVRRVCLSRGGPVR